MIRRLLARLRREWRSWPNWLPLECPSCGNVNDNRPGGDCPVCGADL